MALERKELRLASPSGEFGAIWLCPDEARFAYVFAHGAGAPMTHPWMEGMAAALAEQGIATLRYNFPYIEQRRGPDRPPVVIPVVRAAAEEARELAAGIPIYAGGKSFGGRMTSTAQSESPLPDVRGLIFFGFPLHPPKAPAITRADHLSKVGIPMLFLQGNRDELATAELLRPVVASLGDRVTLYEIPGADHSFAVPKSTGKTPSMVKEELASAASDWMSTHG